MTDFVTYERGNGGFTLSQAQQNELNALLIEKDSAFEGNASQVGLGVDLYVMLLGFISDTDPATGKLVPKDGVDPLVWRWIDGARRVNSGDGFFADFIREYTKEQYRIRGGAPASAEALNQRASNRIALNLMHDILENTTEAGLLPGITGLGAIDAGAAASEVFATLPGLGDGDYAPWAGTLLFPYLGYPNFFSDLLLNDDIVVATIGGDPPRVVKHSTGLFDLVAAVQASAYAAEAAGLANLGESVPSLLFGPDAPYPDQSALVSQTNEYFWTYYGLDQDSIFRPGSSLVFGNIESIGGVGYRVGTNGDDEAIHGREFLGISAPDVIHAGAGDDTIIGGAGGGDLVDGGEGIDTMDYSDFGSDLAVTLNTALAGSSNFKSRVEVAGLATTDFLYGVEKIRLGSGDDTLTIDALDGAKLEGLLEIDLGANGGDEGDTLDFSGMSAGVVVTDAGDHAVNVEGSGGFTLKVVGAETIKGTDYDDEIAGGDLDNYLYGGDGADQLKGGAGEDELHGGDGADRLFGDADNDKLFGDEGDDILYGGKGEDDLRGSNGADTLYADDESDWSDTSKNRLFGEAGDDSLYGASGNDLLDGGVGADLMQGGDGRDLYFADNQDTIMDSDGSGTVNLKGAGNLTGGTRKESDPANEYRRGNTLYALNGTTLTVNGGLTIQQFHNGDLGIFLDTEPDDDEEGPDMGPAETRASPLTIDLNGDGVQTVAYSKDRYFDHDGNGLIESTAWVDANDGLLVRDLNGNGTIDNGGELFGSNTRLSDGSLAVNGFAALGELDENQDGLVDENDAGFASLRIWRDMNGNGLTEAGELLTLAEAGIAAFRTEWTSSSFVDASGQAHKQVGTAIRTSGLDAAVSDVWYTTDPSRRLNQVEVPIEALFDVQELPDARAFGDLADLRQAMALDASLRDLVEAYVDLQDSLERNSLLKDIILQWAGVTQIARNSRGSAVDARELAVVEMMSGRPYTNDYTPDDPNPRPEAGNLLTSEFNKFLQYVGAQIEAQTLYADTGIFQGGFASGYSHVIVDWNSFEQYIIAAHDELDVEKITDLVKLSTTLATYSPTLRSQLEIVYVDLIAERPDIATVLDVVTSIIGTSDADVLYGTSGKDAINGQGGDDTLYGQAGNDVYIYRPGDGNDRIFDSAGSDQLYFMGGILPEHVTLTRDVSSIIVHITVGGVMGEIRINNVFEGTAGALREGLIEQFRFESGAVWSQGQILAAIVQQATNGNDGLYGSSADETFSGLDGDDEISGYGGNDVLNGDGGSDNLAGGTGNDVLNGGDGADILDGGADDDMLNGGAGNDTLDGGVGSDTYVFNAGDGQDTINNYDAGASRLDVLSFGPDIDPADVTARRVDNNLVLTFAGSDDKVAVTNYFVGDGAGAYRLDEIRFADATVWDVAAVKALVLAPTSSADILRGYETDDTLRGGDGNDTLYGNGGNDTLSGDVGNDTIYGGNGDDILFGGAGADILNGDAGHDQLDGGADNDTLRGGAGNDYLTGGLGNDQLEGGEGDDHYHFASGDGQDTINDTQGLSTIHLSGLPLADVFLRRDGTALVLGFSGSPEDQIRLLNYFDPSTELALRALVIDTGSRAPWVLDAAAIDAQVMLGTAADDVIDGNTLDNVIEGLAGNDTLRGSVGADTLDGGAGNDALYGQAGDDVLLGGDGDDLLDGGTGADQLAGDSGDDTYVVDDVGDVVTEAAEAGNDLVRTSISYVLPENVERVELTGTADIDGTGNALDNTLTGNGGNNHLQGLSGDDVLFGNDGDDTLDGGIGDDQLYGGYGADVLIGGAGQDLLDGGAGVDQLAGSAGDDTYRVDESGDVIVELAGEGIDVVQSTAYSYALSANVEHLTLVQGSGAYEGTGNALDNVLTGNGNDNRLDGGAGVDTLIGGLGNDTYVVDNVGDVVVENVGEGADTVESSISYTLGATLENLTLLGTANLDATGNTGDNVIRGNAGNNRIEGGAGADTLYGGAGDDYYVAVSASDRVYEYAGEGIDTVERVFETNLVLENNVENLILGAGITTGNGNGLDNTITGNAGDNTLAGLDGDDVLHGLDGDDALFGGNGTDALYGGTGDDYLDGGAGIDYLEGGVGNDNYIVDHSDDVVVEAAGAGTDQVQASASYALSANVENLFLTGSAAINGAGNDLDNYIAGNGAANMIHGGGGNDTIVGGGGDDTLIGGTGDDKYVFDASSGSDVVDNADGGFDGIFFTNGITRERLSFSRDGDDLLVFVDAGSTPAVRVLNHFLGGDAAIDYVQPDGGYYLTTAEINQIVAGGSTGGEYDQVIEGTAAGEQLVGSSGKDLIKGVAGDDQLFGMSGDDTLQGGEGDDYLSGGNGSGAGSGDDRLEGGAGADTLVGEDGVNTLIGGAGNDNYVYGGGQDTIDNTGGGTDGVFFNNGIAASDLAFYRDGDDLVITVAGNASGFVRVTDHFLGGDLALDFVQPASGNMLNTAAINALVQTGYPGNGEPGGGDPDPGEGDPGTGNPGGGNEGNDADYPNVVTGTANGEQLLGSSGRDLIRGLGGADELFGFGGDDKLDGGDGDDYISGGNGSFSGSGNDILIGGAGNDTLVGEDGNDMLIGGAGDDFYYYASGSGSDTVDNTGGGTDWLYFADVSSTRLSFHQDGDDLIVRVDGDAGQQIRVLDHFLGGEHAISYVQPSNGNAIPASNIPALLTALPQGSGATAFRAMETSSISSVGLTSLPMASTDSVTLGEGLPQDVELPASFVGGAISRPDNVNLWRTDRQMNRHGGIARYWELDGPQFAIDDQLSVSHSAVAVELDGLIHAMAGFQSQEAVIMAQHPYEFRQNPAFAVQA